jgi:hypothetical protein
MNDGIAVEMIMAALRRSLSSCLDATLMWRRTERASSEKKPSTRLSQEPCLGVNSHALAIRHELAKMVLRRVAAICYQQRWEPCF